MRAYISCYFMYYAILCTMPEGNNEYQMIYDASTNRISYDSQSTETTDFAL